MTDLRTGLGSQWRYGDASMINNAGWVADKVYGPGTPTNVTFVYDGTRSRLPDIPGVRPKPR